MHGSIKAQMRGGPTAGIVAAAGKMEHRVVDTPLPEARCVFPGVAGANKAVGTTIACHVR